MSAFRNFGRVVVVVLMAATVLALGVIILGTTGGDLRPSFPVWTWIVVLCGSFAGLCGMLAIFDIADASEEQVKLLRTLADRLPLQDSSKSPAPSMPSKPRKSHLDQLEGFTLKPR